MKNISRDSLEFKYLIFVIILLVAGVLWAGILSLRANLITWNIIISICGISAGAFFFWVVLRRLVITPIQSVEKAAKSLAEGNLSFRIDVKTNDEIGRMGNAINESVASLGAIFRRVKDGSQHVASVVDKVEAEFRNVSESTKLESESIANIATSLEQMNSAAAEISDNVEQLASSTEEKAASMHEIVSSIGQVANGARELSHVVDSTSVSIEELSMTIKEVAGKAEELAAGSEETLAATEQISSSIKEVEQNAKESALLSEKVKTDASTLGLASVEKTIEGIQNIKLSFEKTADFIHKLGGRSNEIGKILNVIDEITDQTTLLALNAAILAAQAGEHGKGFSVVADEIKDLADRTAFSTHEIAELIQAVQQEVKGSILAMNEGLQSVETGLKVARDAGDTLAKIVDSSRQSAEMAFSIERSTTEQARTTRLVSESMEKVKNMVAQVAKATLEQSKGALLITKATEKMRDVATHVSTATSEQLTTTRQISEAMELVSEKSQQISKAVHEQQAGASQIFSAIEKMKDLPKTNVDRVFGMNQSLKGLFKNAELVMSELKGIRLAEENSASARDIDIIRFSVEPVGISPVEVLRRFNPLAEYLGKKVGKRIELKTVSDYEGVLRDIARGITDLYFISPVTYVIANKSYGTKVLVKALMDGKATYRAAIIARSASEINSIEDLKGRKFAFGDPHSLSSYIAARIALLEAGIDLKNLLHYEYLGSHEEVANAVVSGTFDAGGVTERVAYRFKDKGIKVIKFSEELPGFNMAVGKSVPQGFMDSLQLAFTSLTDASPEGSSILHSIYDRYSGFEKTSDNEYARVRIMMSKLGLV
jgi:phosphate/phosphite/phosphonate ABC transporter binding protein